MAQRSHDWFAQAERDLEHSRASARDGRHEWACFAAQQAAEKALKALLLVHNVEAREHSLVELLDYVRAQARIEPPPEILTAARKLDPHYIQARYPGPRGPAPEALYDDVIAKEMIGCAADLLRWVEPLLARP